MANVLVLPGSRWQLALAQRVRDLGHWLCVVSPEQDPPCAAIADDFYRSDIFAVDAIEQHASQLGIEAILSDECDIAMPVVAELGRRLGLATLSPQAAALYTDKSLMRAFCVRNGIGSAAYALCRTVDEAVAFLNDLGKTAIIKPLDSNASHGVFMVRTSDDILRHFDEALSFSRSRREILVEEYIGGVEFTVDGIKTPNAHYTLAISKKRHFAHNPNIASDLYFTHSDPQFDYDLLRQTNDAFVMASPLVYGLTHAEYKFEDGAFKLIEIGARGGGNLISSIIAQTMSGHDTYRYLIDAALGNAADQDFSILPAYQERATILKFFHTPQGGGKVMRIEGLEHLQSEPAILDYQINFAIGDHIEAAESDSARIGFYIACADNARELDDVVRAVDERFHIGLA
ncbi:MAG: ATP-grasp domain-containing protein [Acidobacteriota bacterium]|nr:ATP-grasp domain-containing protein [Acidobacteriota bacterium]